MRGDRRGPLIKAQSQYNVVVLGETRSGKTTLVSQWMFNTVKSIYKPTIEDCYRTLTRLPDGQFKTIQLVDTAGTMEFPAMRELRIKSANAVVIVYNAMSGDSINKAALIKKQAQQIREYDGVPMIVIGNYKGKLSHDVKLPVPAGVIGDEYCTHWHINLTDTSKCRQVYNAIIKTCFDNCSWKIEVWAHGERLDNNNNTQQKKISKRRGILSYLSFRRKKKPQDQNPASSRFHSTKSTP